VWCQQSPQLAPTSSTRAAPPLTWPKFCLRWQHGCCQYMRWSQHVPPRRPAWGAHPQHPALLLADAGEAAQQPPLLMWDVVGQLQDLAGRASRSAGGWRFIREPSSKARGAQQPNSRPVRSRLLAGRHWGWSQPRPSPPTAAAGSHCSSTARQSRHAHSTPQDRWGCLPGRSRCGLMAGAPC
jgi:hypothetical protein